MVMRVNRTPVALIDIAVSLAKTSAQIFIGTPFRKPPKELLQNQFVLYPRLSEAL
jgi:hypothetical protein